MADDGFTGVRQGPDAEARTSEPQEHALQEHALNAITWTLLDAVTQLVERLREEHEAAEQATEQDQDIGL